jgi:hypothetical protein
MRALCERPKCPRPCNSPISIITRPWLLAFSVGMHPNVRTESMAPQLRRLLWTKVRAERRFVHSAAILARDRLARPTNGRLATDRPTLFVTGVETHVTTMSAIHPGEGRGEARRRHRGRELLSARRALFPRYERAGVLAPSVLPPALARSCGRGQRVPVTPGRRTHIAANLDPLSWLLCGVKMLWGGRRGPCIHPSSWRRTDGAPDAQVAA